MRISDIAVGMRRVNLQGKIVDMNGFMIVLDDGSGRTFIRYRAKDLETEVKTGDRIQVLNSRVVNYSGIMQVRLERGGRIVSLSKPAASVALA
jgi:uncharacterized protein (AIM24 family)